MLPADMMHVTGAGASIDDDDDDADVTGRDGCFVVEPFSASPSSVSSDSWGEDRISCIVCKRGGTVEARNSDICSFCSNSET